MMEAAAGRLSAADRGARGEWTREVAATLALAWPMILSNLAGTGMGTIDVVLVGRLGPEPLAAAALATNLFHAVMLTGIGLVTAVSPLVAAEYGRCRHAVRDIRRTVRQGLWVATAICAPAWLLLYQGERVLLAFGQDPKLAAEAGSYLRALQWALLPNFTFVVLRLFMAALGRPGWGLAGRPRRPARERAPCLDADLRAARCASSRPCRSRDRHDHHGRTRLRGARGGRDD
jgi:MATE family multidrug resistance protein